MENRYTTEPQGLFEEAQVKREHQCMRTWDGDSNFNGGSRLFPHDGSVQAADADLA